jgi:hypothetical protein
MTLKSSFILAAALSTTAYAGVVYDESVAGDLSNTGTSLTTITVGLGSNQIFGATGNVTGVDRDYFTFTVPAGLQLMSLTVLPGTVSGGVSFIGLEAGNQITLPTNTVTAAGLLGWRHYSPADINTNILPLMAVPATGSSGFTTPLGSGSYAVWIQDSSPGTLAYGFDLAVAAPEPRDFATMIPALAALLFLQVRRRRARTA